MNAKRIPPTKTHAEMVSDWMGQPEFKAEYEKLDGEFALLDELLAARKKAGLSGWEPKRRRLRGWKAV